MILIVHYTSLTVSMLCDYVSVFNMPVARLDYNIVEYSFVCFVETIRHGVAMYNNNHA